MFGSLLLYVLQLHINLPIVFHYFELLVKCLPQLFKNAIWIVLNVVFSPFIDTILESKTKQVDDVKFYCFTISFNGLFVGYCNFLYGSSMWWSCSNLLSRWSCSIFELMGTKWMLVRGGWFWKPTNVVIVS
jgi:hypothetical protein